MPVADADVRRAHFAAFVRRAVDHARVTRDWSVRRIGAEADIAPSTIQRWLAGDWVEDPRGAQVQKFCNTLDIPPTIAFAILWPGAGETPGEPAPLPSDPDLREIQRALLDPNIPDAEKYHVRASIRTLAAHVQGERRSRRAS